MHELEKIKGPPKYKSKRVKKKLRKQKNPNIPMGSLHGTGSEGILGGPHPAALIAITRNW